MEGSEHGTGIRVWLLTAWSTFVLPKLFSFFLELGHQANYKEYAHSVIKFYVLN